MGDMVWIIVGILVGAGATGAVLAAMRRRQRAGADELLQEARRENDERLQQMLGSLRDTFSALSREALSTNTDEFFKIAGDKFAEHTKRADLTLDTKKKLIDARLEELGAKVTSLNTLIQSIEKQRAEAHGSLKTQLERATAATDRLQDTTGHLREALANPQRRGQWGERMAEDVLRLAGFLENVNYTKQSTIDGGARPDFTFPLPGGLIVHMDVKFPLANYLKMLDADDGTREKCKAVFLRDVRDRVREVTTREYIDPSRGTVDYVLVFIPNEQIYGFIHEQDAGLLDDAMRSKVVLCSPLTLYAILAVIRQSVENFRLEQGAKQILGLLADFKKQWLKFVECMDRLGKRLGDASKEYDSLVGVRTRQLERQLDKIDNLCEDGLGDENELPQSSAALLPETAAPPADQSEE